MINPEARGEKWFHVIGGSAMFQYKYVKTRRGRFGGIYNLLQRN